MNRHVEREEALRSLVDSLVQVDVVLFRGEEFPKQISEAVELLKQAIVNMGNEMMPILKEKYVEWEDDLLIELIGDIGDPQSLDFLVEAYKHSTFMSGMLSLIAIRKLKTDEAYERINNLLLDIINEKNDFIVLSTNETVMMCAILGDWNDPQAIETLKSAININEPPGMPKAAIEALANYKEAHPYLGNLAAKDKSLSEIIWNALNNHGEQYSIG